MGFTPLKTLNESNALNAILACASLRFASLCFALLGSMVFTPHNTLLEDAIRYISLCYAALSYAQLCWAELSFALNLSAG